MSRFGLLAFGLLVSSQFVFAENFQFNYSDTLAVNGATIYQLSGTNEVNKVTFAQGTPISATAIFNSSQTMDISAPFPYPYPLAAAWQASSGTITIGGVTYKFDQSKTPMDVTFFDTQSPFSLLMDPGMKGHYGIGLVESINISDGAGFIADYTGEANTAITEKNIGPDVFRNYNGTGFASGVGSDCSTVNGDYVCQHYSNEAIDLIGPNGQEYYLQFGNGHNDSFYVGADKDTNFAATVSFNVDPVAAPEPSASLLAFAGLGLLLTGAGLKRLRPSAR